MTNLVERIKYSKTVDKIKKSNFKKYLIYVFFGISFVMLCSTRTELKKVNKKISKTSSINEKTMEEENLETYNKRLLLDIDGRINEIEKSLNVLEVLLNQENFLAIKNEIHNLAEVQEQFVELLQLEIEEDESQNNKSNKKSK